MFGFILRLEVWILMLMDGSTYTITKTVYEAKHPHRDLIHKK